MSHAPDDSEADEIRASWSHFVADAIAAVDGELDALPTPTEWRKADGSVVSELDVRIDLAIRGSLSRWFPGVPALSEELGWLLPAAGRRQRVVAVIDSIDGTESMLQKKDFWWSSVAILVDNHPVAGLIRQPIRNVTHDSQGDLPTLSPTQSDKVGLSRPPLEATEFDAARVELVAAGFHPTAAPHAVEKVAAVLEGRCAASISVPTKKSPTWQTWDLCAVMAIAEARSLCLMTVSGEPLGFDGLEEAYSAPWICARDEETWMAVREAWLRSTSQRRDH